MTHPIPDAALDGRLCIVGISGSGKSTTAKGGVERLLNQGRRVCIVDLLDGWWGLRVKRDGHTAAFPVAIFGGQHGDLPLTEHAGALIGHAVAQSEGSTIVSLAELDGDAARRRFALAFFDALHRTNRAPLHLVVDEADFYAPQQPVKEGPGPLLLNRVKEIAARGRMRGFRCWPITQRPAKLHKDVLSQADTLIAMQLTSSQDRGAIEGWIGDQGDKAVGKTILAALPGLQLGQGVLWAPRLGILDTVRFPLPATYDSSRTPEYGEKIADVELRPIDLGVLREKLGKVEAERAANDPKALRSEIAKLKAELARKPVAEVSGAQLAEAQLDGRKQGFTEGVDATWRFFGEHIHAHARKFDEVTIALTSVVAQHKPTFQRVDIPHTPAAARPTAAPRPIAPLAAPPQRREGDHSLTGPQRHLLSALAWWAAMGHAEPRRPQVAAIAGWSTTGSNLRNRLSELHNRGLVAYPREGLVRLTDEGAAAAPEPDMAATMADGVRAVLTGPQLVLFDALIGTYAGGPVDRATLATQVGWEPGGSNLRNRLSELKTLDVIDYPSTGMVEISDWLKT